MGLSLATLGEITFKTGAEQGNFQVFQVTRVNAAPREIASGRPASTHSAVGPFRAYHLLRLPVPKARLSKPPR